MVELILSEAQLACLKAAVTREIASRLLAVARCCARDSRRDRTGEALGTGKSLMCTTGGHESHLTELGHSLGVDGFVEVRLL
jgi:hypothetical protein